VLDVGSATAEAAPDVSPFAGSWSGSWSIPEREIFGDYDWTISDEGRIEGTLYHAVNGMSGTMTGHVGADGKLGFTGMAPNDVPSTGINGFHFQGTAVIDGDGKLVVSATGLGESQSGRPALVAVLERN
jgi:hypothetical protein